MLKKARYIPAVYQSGSLTKAAEALYISQPCLNAAIKQIESEIGACLFDRSTTLAHPSDLYFERKEIPHRRRPPFFFESCISKNVAIGSRRGAFLSK